MMHQRYGGVEILGEVLELGVRSPNVPVLLVSFVQFCRNR